MNRKMLFIGYSDTNEVWKEEFENEDLEDVITQLYLRIKKLYSKLHGFVRFNLRKYYGSEIVSEKGSIPAHILGTMSANNWANILDLLIENPQSITAKLIERFPDTDDLVKLAEDAYYRSGFPFLPDSFWAQSEFNNVRGNCHPTAVNMFVKDDVRIFLCGGVNGDQLYAILHEMGHVQYFLHYQNQQNIFKDGATSAMQECAGDALALSAFNLPNMVKWDLLKKEDEFSHLLRMGLRLIPQVPFALALEKWRSRVYSGSIPPDNYNKEWWKLRRRHQGVKPPEPRADFLFDPVAEYHIASNTPYMRYFMSSFCQMQVLESMCKYSNYSSLHLCDVTDNPGNSANLRRMMRFGSTIGFDEAMNMVTMSSISAEAFLHFFEPLESWLDKQIRTFNIPIGWK